MFGTTPSLRRRMACWMYEGTIMFGVVFVAGYLFSTLTQTKHALDNRHYLQAFLFVVFGIYFAWFWAKGQTIAQKSWHIRVVGIHGQAITQARGVARYVLSWLWLLPPLAAAGLFKLKPMELTVIALGWVVSYALLSRLLPHRQFLHDVVAGTRLVDYRPVEAAKAAAAGQS
jgi:uncharacterized RDD family membrane protein YckC